MTWQRALESFKAHLIVFHDRFVSLYKPILYKPYKAYGGLQLTLLVQQEVLRLEISSETQLRDASCLNFHHLINIY